MDTIRNRRSTIPAIFAILVLTCATVGMSGCATTGHPATAKATRPEFATWLCGKIWLLAGYCPGATFIPLEPEHGTTAFIVFKADGPANGSTGVNEFTGTWSAKKPDRTGTAAFIFRLKQVSGKQAPNDIAAHFDRDFLRLLEETRALKTEKDFIRLTGERGETLLRFIYRTDAR